MRVLGDMTLELMLVGDNNVMQAYFSHGSVAGRQSYALSLRLYMARDFGYYNEGKFFPS